MTLATFFYFRIFSEKFNKKINEKDLNTVKENIFSRRGVYFE